MDHNIYVYHRGTEEYILGKPFLFVFPYSETLTTGDMSRFMESELTKKINVSLPKVKACCTRIDDQILKRRVAWNGRKKVVSLAEYYGNYLRFTVHLMDSMFFSRYGRFRKNREVKGKIDEMINLYESIMAKQSATEASSSLEANDIIYYDAQKNAGPKNFDKRSPEGKALISAKRIVQREKLLAQRGYNIKAKRRERNIDMSRLELQDNCKTITDPH
ncbi:hypothetical protein GGI24_002528 [Coemansia furcata]|nr:hypothetical protein GGI24_002528 [Coemansia furcata]